MTTQTVQTGHEAAPRRTPWSFDHHRGLLAVMTGLFGVVLCAIFYEILPDAAAKIMIDRGGIIYPFSVQNGMWVVFCIAVGELCLRARTAAREMQQLTLGFLPEDPRVVLQAEDLGPIYRRVRESGVADQRFLLRLVSRCVLQFQISASVEQCTSLMNATLELIGHEIELRYSPLRYITWLIPSLGFIGTVIGIGHALSYAGEPGRFQQPTLLTEVTGRLAVSFDGTLVALLMAAVLLFCQSLVESREEQALNLSGQYCLDHLINRLYVPRTSATA